MNDILIYLLAGVAGAALGAFFFGGLWWTVQKITTSERPAVWTLASFVIRMLVTVGGFFLVADGQWQRIVACLLGFLIARAVVTRITDKDPSTPLNPEPTHAP